ncbi:MAG: nitroreductase family protein [Oscillospiraceae bacterium]
MSIAMDYSENPVLQAILARRSIRSYLDKPVEEEKVQLLLEAAMAAPSACNLQPWTFVVAKEETQLEALRGCFFGGEFTQPIKAPLMVTVCGSGKHIPWEGNGWLVDCAAAAQNMLLAATALGLGSLWVGGFHPDKVSQVLGLPDELEPMALLCFGYAAQERPPHTWYDPDAVHKERYDSGRQRKWRTQDMLRTDP